MRRVLGCFGVIGFGGGGFQGVWGLGFRVEG